MLANIIRTCCRCSSLLSSRTFTTRSCLFPVSLVKRYYSKDSGDKPTGSFETFKDSSRIIFDVDEERQLRLNNPNYVKLYETPEELVDEFEDLNLDRGITGVFDIEDLVDVLHKQRGEDVAVISIPPEFSYVDFIVVVTGKSYKHMLATATFVRHVFKKKYDPDRADKLPRIEGEDSKDWIAMDLGNIALHIFSKPARKKYDLESLWCLGQEFDANSRPQDDLISLLEKQSLSLSDLQAIDEVDSIK